MTTRMIGARIPRNEDPRLLRGLGCFVDDVAPGGVLHAAGLRSPHAPRAHRVDRRGAGARPARRSPGPDRGRPRRAEPAVAAPDPASRPDRSPRTQRPLAADEVRYMGEMVAFVVADDRYVAEDAVGADRGRATSRCPPSTDLEAARADGAPLVHADVPGEPRGAGSCSAWATRTRAFAARGPRAPRAAVHRAELRQPHRGPRRRGRVRPATRARSGCGARRRRRCRSRTGSRGSSACRSSRWR